MKIKLEQNDGTVVDFVEAPAIEPETITETTPEVAEEAPEVVEGEIVEPAV